LRHRSRAHQDQGRAAGDGSYKITGTKIFISSGEHDLAENIIHLVLAKITGAP
jgi:alkylation response protein AidB-like acyl-CoA dehydrogenase